MTTALHETNGSPQPNSLQISEPLRLALVAEGSSAELTASMDGLTRTLAAAPGSDVVIRVQTPGARPASHRGTLLLDAATKTVVARETAAGAMTPPAVAFLLPGLGDHYLGMARDLYNALPIFREQVDRCAALLTPELGVDIRTVMHAKARASAAAPGAELDLRRMLGRRGEGPSEEERRLNQARHAQPALFVVEYALAEQWRAWGVLPDVMLGYSLGEYVAACLAGVLSLEDSLALVARRAELIESLPAGAMLAVMLSEEELTPQLGAHLSVSAVNGPDFCVVAGPVEEVQRLEARLLDRRVTLRRVQSSHAFHSRMMEPIAERVTRIVAGFTRRPPRTPYVSNVTGALITAAEATDPAYWAIHLCRPVRFADGLRALGSEVLLEVGPGQTLSSLATLARKGAGAPSSGGSSTPARTIVASMRHAYESESDVSVLLKAVGRLWLSGAAIEGEQPATSAEPAAPADAEAGRGSMAPVVEEISPPAEPEAPLTDTEREVAALWQTLLRCEPPTRDANFFRLGGNSLLATRLIDRVSRSLRVKLPLRRVYQTSTLADMAAAIDGLRGAGARPGAATQGRAAPVTTSAPTAAARPAAAAPDAPRAPLFRLPNGLSVAHQNEAETRHFYDDIFAHRSYVKHGIRIRDGACVLDVGGNIGLFTLFAHTEAKDVRVFTFEPAPPLFEILSRNVALHGVRATLFNLGLSDRERDAPFTFYPRSAGMSSFYPDEAEERHNLKAIMDNQRRGGAAEVAQMDGYTEELLDVRFEAVTFTAKLRRLSDVLREQRIERVDLMKIDVQKCELEVIEGIDDADWPKFSQIVLEAHDADGRVAKLSSLFERHGFKVIAEQDELYVGTNIRNIYALREGV
nr:putative methoxymalonyl-CoA synthase [Sorangium cellulosum]